MTKLLAHSIPYRDACTIARAHPGSVLTRDGTAFKVGF